MNERDSFFDVPLTTRRVGDGEVSFPILYFDTSCLLAFFVVGRERAEAALEGTGLVPSLVLGRRAMVGMAFYEYRRCAIAPYNEVALAVPSIPATGPRARSLRDMVFRRDVGAHILDLPVTTEQACAAGRQVWGYPKFVAHIDFQLDGSTFRSAVEDPGGAEPLVVLEGRLGVGLPAPPLNLVLYSFLDGEPLRTVVDVRGAMRVRRGAGLRLTVGSSEHRMADDLRQLGLDGARPLIVMDTHAFQSRLNLGARRGPPPGRTP